MDFTAPVPFPVRLRALTLLWEPWNPRSEPFLRLEIMAAGNHDFFSEFHGDFMGFPWDFHQCKWWIYMTWWWLFMAFSPRNIWRWSGWSGNEEFANLKPWPVRQFVTLPILKMVMLKSFVLYVYQRVMDDYWMMNGISLFIFLWTYVFGLCKAIYPPNYVVLYNILY